MALRGSLNEVNLADICQLLALGAKTGCLWITDRSNFGYIYFNGGRVTYASVLNRPDRLGELLVQNSVITREQLSAAMEGQAMEPGAKLGRVLVSQGAMDEDGRLTVSNFEPIPQSVFRASVAHNSADNQWNPNQPPRRVTYGLESADEMCEFWLQVLPRSSERKTP